MFFDHYPYTNFHNVNLDWVLQAVKAWGQTVEANDQAFKDLEEANESFKSYVTNYLQDLDVQDEINTKLDDMLASGVLTPYFAPYVEGYVTSWLNAHITPTSPALDNTLSVSGAAAESHYTGHRMQKNAYLAMLGTPRDYASINRELVIPGYRVQGVTYNDGTYYVCGGSQAETGTGIIATMSDLNFKDVQVTEIAQLGHANDITYSDADHYLYVCSVGEGGSPQWGIWKINPNDFTDKTLISNAPENTIGIQYRWGDYWILAPYRIYRTTDFQTYEIVVENTNDMLTQYGIPTDGRISQSLVRTADHIIGWVAAFVYNGRHYGAITYFSSTGQPIAFDMFPTFNAEVQCACYADMSLWVLGDGNLINVLRADVLHKDFIQLQAGDDLNDYTGRGTLYSTGSNISGQLVNPPSSGEGFTVQVERLGMYNTIQTSRTNSGRELYRIKSFTDGTWGEWIEPAAEVAQIKEDLSAYALTSGKEQGSLYMSGGIADTGAVSSINTRIRSVSNQGNHEVKSGDYYWCDDNYMIRVAIYSKKTMTSGNFVSFLNNFKSGIVVIPDLYVGQYANVLIEKIGEEDVDISGDISTIYQHVKYISPKADEVPLTENTSNYTIMCAKEVNFSDGTPPATEYYIIRSPKNEYYTTKDFASFKRVPIDLVGNNVTNYKIAIMPNDDIICVYRSENKTSGSSDATNRKNPFVFLASENYMVLHEVDFGSSLKPSGWLENVGFCPMPNGGAMFCEYTRPSVETANVWKVSGDLTDSTNWVVKKSFTLSGTLEGGFKHCHGINYDFYHNVYYVGTGDDDTGSQVWHSTDNGETWTQTMSASQKYCRMLNMIFTPDYIYWASDNFDIDKHYLFRCERNASNILDISTVTELANLYHDPVATYGIAYLRTQNLFVFLDRADLNSASEMPFRLYDLTEERLVTLATLETATGEPMAFGFRTEYSEFNPSGNSILCGFGLKFGPQNTRNLIKGLGNAGDPSGWEDNVNNLRLIINKSGTYYSLQMKTAFMV